jgi:TrmH family RNA methyltransferase
MADAPRLLSARTNPLLKDLRRLVDDPGAYRRVGRVWLEGDHLLRALMARGGVAQEVLLTPAAWARTDLQALAQRSGARLSLVEPALMAEISSLETPAALGAVMAWPGAQADGPRPLDTVVLDRLQDAGNVGTILRSAAALGAQQVIALKGTAALWSPKVLRAGMGAHFSLHLFESVDADRLDALGVPLLATSSHGGHLLHEAPLPSPAAWVFGHEGQGVAPALMAACAATVRIPQPGGEESLNVAAAAAVCLYESLRRRMAQ